MKSLKTAIILFCAIGTLSCNSQRMEYGKWSIAYNPDSKGIIIEHEAVKICDDLYASYVFEGRKISVKDYSSVKSLEKSINDDFGSGKVFTVTYKKKGLPTLAHSFYVYDGKDYILTDFTLENGTGEIASNYMAPVNIHNLNLLKKSDENRALFIPFDNDKWIRFKSHRLDFDQLTSYEVTSVFNNENRKGVVLGSVEHDKWKSAVSMTGDKSGRLDSLICYGGVADELTRDSKPHGMVSGKTIKSPKVMLGVFDDWRNGLDKYAEANAAIARPKAWNKAVPFGWNSWGVLQFKLTFGKAMEVSDYFAKYLQSAGFVNPDKTVYVGLDSGWNSFTEDELKAFVQKCKANGQIACIYWTPFTDWGKNPEAVVRDAESYKFKDIYLYADGKPQELDGAYSVDPTHPAVEERMKKTSDLFRRCGFEYVKMDFMTHAAMEADSRYRPEITTGIQAYNYGMQLLNKYFGDMYVNLSISPVFPAHYAQSRRIACDAWNKIKDTEYTMNALSYGWWIGKVYQYNDADHIVLRGATEGENRARITSAVITGLYITGDDFSNEGDVEGKERALKYLTNKNINDIANGVSFRPLEGAGNDSENQFVRVEKDGIYYVYFNYTDSDTEINIPLGRMGLNANKNHTSTELWSNRAVDVKEKLTVPAKDVIVLFIPAERSDNQ